MYKTIIDDKLVVILNKSDISEGALPNFDMHFYSDKPLNVIQEYYTLLEKEKVVAVVHTPKPFKNKEAYRVIKMRGGTSEDIFFTKKGLIAKIYELGMKEWETKE